MFPPLLLHMTTYLVNKYVKEKNCVRQKNTFLSRKIPQAIKNRNKFAQKKLSIVFL